MGIDSAPHGHHQIAEPHTHGELRNVLLACEKVRKEILGDPNRDSEELQSIDAQLLLLAFAPEKKHQPDREPLSDDVRMQVRMLLKGFGVLQSSERNSILRRMQKTGAWIGQIAGML